MTCPCLVYTNQTPGIARLGLGAAALRYQSQGYAVLPLQRAGKRPHRVLGDRGGVHWATLDTRMPPWAWGQDPAANVGVATGSASRLVVIDLDIKHGADGPVNFGAFLAERRLAMPAEPAWAATPSGGLHIWLRISVRVLVTGSRDWADQQMIAAALAQHWGDGRHVLVTGRCRRGADAIAERIWRSWGGQVDPHPADWGQHGKPAGKIRNTEMVGLGAGVCLAFSLGTPGTGDCMTKAAGAGIPVLEYAPGKPWPDPVLLALAVPERPGILPGVDVKGDGGLIVAPPSMQLRSGIDRPGERGAEPVPVPYEWSAGCPCQVPDAPPWLLPWLATTPVSGSPHNAGGGEIGEGPDLASLTETGIPRGERNITLYRLACQRFRAHGVDPQGSVAVRAELAAVLERTDRTGFSEHELSVITDSARRFVQDAINREKVYTDMYEKMVNR